MWGFVSLLDESQFSELPPGVPPLAPAVPVERFETMLGPYPARRSKGIKGFLVATSHHTPDCINGLGNAIVQDILFNAGLSPKRKTQDITPYDRRRLYDAIQETVRQAADLGGRYDEVDLFGRQGRYVRLMDSKAAGKPCPNCGRPIEKISYLGGACYLCPACQP